MPFWGGGGGGGGRADMLFLKFSVHMFITCSQVISIYFTMRIDLYRKGHHEFHS